MTLCGMSSNHVTGTGESVCSTWNSGDGSITLPCPAKLNVFLEITGKRPDGYHELETVMLRTRFADQLTVRRTDSERDTLRFSDATPEALRSGVPLDGRNLILRAAEAVRQRIGNASGVEFILHKRIPPESGLAGGSSNAASALLACRELWDAGLSDAELQAIAASLGSDINFLLSGHRAAVCRGRGEIIEPIVLNRVLYFVAVRPRQGNSTAAVFRNTKLSSMPISSARIVESLTGLRSEPFSRHIFNRLTAAASEMNPAMAELIARLQKVANRPVFMSGSGSAVFVVARHAQEAAKLQRQIREQIHRTSWILEC